MAIERASPQPGRGRARCKPPHWVAAAGRVGGRCGMVLGRRRRSEGVARWDGEDQDPGVRGGGRWGREEALWHSANGSSEGRRGAQQRGAEGGHELVQNRRFGNLQTRGARWVAVVEKRHCGILQTGSNEGIATQGNLEDQQNHAQQGSVSPARNNRDRASRKELLRLETRNSNRRHEEKF